MSACEKCWGDAFLAARHGEDQSDAYRRLLRERKDTPCTPEQQCGDVHERSAGACRCGKYPVKQEATR